MSLILKGIVQMFNGQKYLLFTLNGWRKWSISIQTHVLMLKGIDKSMQTIIISIYKKFDIWVEAQALNSSNDVII